MFTIDPGRPLLLMDLDTACGGTRTGKASQARPTTAGPHACNDYPSDENNTILFKREFLQESLGEAAAFTAAAAGAGQATEATDHQHIL